MQVHNRFEVSKSLFLPANINASFQKKDSMRLYLRSPAYSCYVDHTVIRDLEQQCRLRPRSPRPRPSPRNRRCRRREAVAGTGAAHRHRTIYRLSTQMISIRSRQFGVFAVSKLPSPFPILFYSDHHHPALEDANEMVFVLQEVLSLVRVARARLQHIHNRLTSLSITLFIGEQSHTRTSPEYTTFTERERE